MQALARSRLAGAFVLSSALSGPAAYADSGAEAVDRAILGGKVSDQRAVVALLNKDRRLACTGTFVRPHVVVTAAHCVDRLAGEPTTVFVGGDLSQPGSALQIVERLIHPEFTPEALYADIALLAVDVDVDVTPLALARAEPSAGFAELAIEVLGFGCTSATDETVGLGLRRAAADTVRELTDDDKLRHGPTCRGDSGGPLVTVGATRTQIVGLVSSGGDKDGSPFSLSTSVPAFSAWAEARADELETDRAPASQPAGGCGVGSGTRFGAFWPLCLGLAAMCRRRRVSLCR